MSGFIWPFREYQFEAGGRGLAFEELNLSPTHAVPDLPPFTCMANSQQPRGSYVSGVELCGTETEEKRAACFDPFHNRGIFVFFWYTVASKGC